MRLPPAFLFTVLCFTPVLSAQNLFEIYSSCTNFTSRGGLDGHPGEMLLQVPFLQQSAVGQDPSGRASRLRGFSVVTQDQNGATPSVYSMVLRADRGGSPDCTPLGLLALLGPFTLPRSTGIGAWNITHDFATPYLDPRLLCDTFYLGMELAAAPQWTADGQSVHISTYATVSGQGRGSAPAPSAPNIAWHCIAGIPALQPVAATLRIGARVDAATLAMGNEDPTWMGACTNPLDFGVGGFWPQAQGPFGARNDGLHARVRDIDNLGGAFAVALDVSFLCPGAPVPGVQGAWHLGAGAVIVASDQLGANGQGQAMIFPPGFVTLLSRLFTSRMLFTQALTVGPAGVKLSNRAGVMYRP
jgi:hypothetical protein